MESVRAKVLASYTEAASDAAFLASLQELAGEYGDAVYQALFDALVDVRLGPEEAGGQWLKLLAHRDRMSASLQRDVDLITSFSDHFYANTGHLKRPKLVEIANFERVSREATHDSLTGLLNKQYLENTLPQQLAYVGRNNDDLSLLFLDVDDFKQINDTHGHPCKAIRVNAR